MKWTVVFYEEFEAEFDHLPAEVQDDLYAEVGFIEMFGPETGRPHVDTLKGSSFPNMKEFRGDGRRVACSFRLRPKTPGDLPDRRGQDGWQSEKFYKRLIAIADARYGRHLSRLKVSRTGRRRDSHEDVAREIECPARKPAEEDREAH